jgi:NhaP-type Na+/H+ or K+/H+ antiporter
MSPVAAFAIVLLVLSLVSGRLTGSLVTPAMVCVAAGLVLGLGVLGLVDVSFDSELVLLVGQVALVFLLFASASKLHLSLSHTDPQLPGRLLAIGMPLTILAGAALGAVLLPRLSFWEAAIMATLLAPTDAALGQAVVTNPRLPERFRQALDMESGLNDGLSVPFLTVFIALAEQEQARLPRAGEVPSFLPIALEAIGLGVLSGWRSGCQAAGCSVRHDGGASPPVPSNNTGPWRSRCWPGLWP